MTAFEESEILASTGGTPSTRNVVTRAKRIPLPKKTRDHVDFQGLFYALVVGDAPGGVNHGKVVTRFMYVRLFRGGNSMPSRSFVACAACTTVYTIS